jgi:hypothetical protein
MRFIFCWMLTFIMSQVALAQMVPIAVFNNREPTLKFLASSVIQHNHICSAVQTLRTTYGGSANFIQSGDLVVDLQTVSGITYYSDRDCTQPISSVTIAAGSSSAQFYFITTDIGALSFDATATDWKKATMEVDTTTNPFIWIGATSNNWSTGSNWSGGVAPASTDIAVFNSSCTVHCNPEFTSDGDVLGIRILSSYSGTVNQSLFNLRIRGAGLIILGGSFIGTTDVSKELELTNNGSFKVYSGSLTMPSGFTIINGDWFIHASVTPTIPANSTLRTFNRFSSFTGEIKYFSGSHFPYENLHLTTYRDALDFGGETYQINRNLTYGNFTSNNWAEIVNGTFEVRGDVIQEGGGNSGNYTVKLIGNPDGQSLIGNGSRRRPEWTIIDAGTSDVTLVGEVVALNWIVESVGTLNTAGSKLAIACFPNSGDNQCYQRSHLIQVGSERYNDVNIEGARGSWDLQGGTLYVDGDFSFGDGMSTGQGRINNGEIQVRGDIYQLETRNGHAGTVNLVVVGNPAGQTIYGVGNPSQMTGGITYFPSLEIDAGAHPVTLSGGILVSSHYIYRESGTFTATGSHLSLHCVSSSPPCHTSSIITDFGGQTYDNLSIYQHGTEVDLGGDIIVLGDLYVGDRNTTAGSRRDIRNGNIFLHGNLYLTRRTQGDAGIRFVGSTDQVLEQVNHTDSIFGDFIVNKTGGRLNLATNFSLVNAGQALTISSGEVDMLGFDMSIPGTLTIDSGASLTQGGGALSYGALINNGDLFP